MLTLLFLFQIVMDNITVLYYSARSLHLMFGFFSSPCGPKTSSLLIFFYLQIKLERNGAVGHNLKSVMLCCWECQTEETFFYISEWNTY